MVEAKSSQKYVYYTLAYSSYYVAWLHLHYLWHVARVYNKDRGRVFCSLMLPAAAVVRVFCSSYAHNVKFTVYILGIARAKN